MGGIAPHLCHFLNASQRFTYAYIDVLLLADIFEAFRDVCMKNYQLDAAHYISAPQLSWDAMLKLTNMELELISDPEMFKMIDNGKLISPLEQRSILHIFSYFIMNIYINYVFSYSYLFMYLQD